MGLTKKFRKFSSLVFLFLKTTSCKSATLTVFKISNLRSGQGSADERRSREEIMEKERIEYIASDWEEKEEWGIALRDKTAQPMCNPTTTLITEKNKREIQGDLGNWDCCTQTLSVVEGSRKLWKPSDNFTLLLFAKDCLMCISSIETGGIRWGFFLFEVFPLRILQTCSLTVPFGGKYSDKKRLGDGSGKWY